jgi:hypothetical protein
LAALPFNPDLTVKIARDDARLCASNHTSINGRSQFNTDGAPKIDKSVQADTTPTTKTVFSSSPQSSIFMTMSEETMTLGVDDSLLESAARCLDTNSVRALSELQLDEAARARLDVLAQKANEGQLAPEEAREYERFIDLSDIISTLRLKAERQVGDLAHAE